MSTRKGKTKEPCHGCGKQDIGPIISYRPGGEVGPRPFRATSEVCSECKALLKDGERWRVHVAKAGRTTESIQVRMPTVDYGWPGYYEGDAKVPPDARWLFDIYRAKLSHPRRDGTDIYAELQHVVWLLAYSVSEEVQTQSWDADVPRMFTVDGSHSFLGLSLIHPFIHRLINDLDALIRLALHWSYWNGVKYGWNLIRQLNTGETTLAAAEEEVAGEVRAREALHKRLGIQAPRARGSVQQAKRGNRR